MKIIGQVMMVVMKMPMRKMISGRGEEPSDLPRRRSVSLKVNQPTIKYWTRRVDKDGPTESNEAVAELEDGDLERADDDGGDTIPDRVVQILVQVHASDGKRT